MNLVKECHTTNLIQLHQSNEFIQVSHHTQVPIELAQSFQTKQGTSNILLYFLF